ncbi:MAG: phage tail assembly chaperone [Ilumatobacteraceae bacterium]|jgi:hypothetical protein|nr:phage tail assembly chaperone [Ilumatobacteraceae bacterium]
MIITVKLCETANKAQLIAELSSAGYQATIRETESCVDVISDDYDAVVTICKPYIIKAPIEQRWESVKSQRNALLTSCDWTQLHDAPLADNERAAWQQYRQALRDLPQTYQSPDDVVFPEVP